MALPTSTLLSISGHFKRFQLSDLLNQVGQHILINVQRRPEFFSFLRASNLCAVLSTRCIQFSIKQESNLRGEYHNKPIWNFRKKLKSEKLNNLMIFLFLEINKLQSMLYANIVENMSPKHSEDVHWTSPCDVVLNPTLES